MSAPTLKARRTLYRGVAMRSRLEAHWAQRLDALGATWSYEPQCFADESGQYLPDFKVVLPTGTALYIECKGTWPDEQIPELQRRMEIVWSSEPALLMLAVGASVWFGTIDNGWVYQGEGEDEWHGGDGSSRGSSAPPITPPPKRRSKPGT